MQEVKAKVAKELNQARRQLLEDCKAIVSGRRADAAYHASASAVGPGKVSTTAGAARRMPDTTGHVTAGACTVSAGANQGLGSGSGAGTHVADALGASATAGHSPKIEELMNELEERFAEVCTAVCQ